MAETAASLFDPSVPTLQRVRALIALMLRLLLQPDRAAEVERLCAETEALLAAHLLKGAIALSGRTDISGETHEAYVIWRGGLMQFGVRARPGALHPLHRIIIERRRALRRARILRALARRTRFSRKRHKIYARAHRRSYGAACARHVASRRAPAHMPTRIAAPP